MRQPVPTLVARAAALAAAYVVLAKLGLHVAVVSRSVTLVWPPTGLALAALLLGSRSLWPGVAVGAFIANVSTPGVGALTAALIAAGNTLEALVGATLIARAPFRPQLDTPRDVVRLAALGACVAPTVSATVGALALFAGGHIPAAALVSTLRIWWFGDAMGALVVAPALLTWGARAGELERRSAAEVAALVAALMGAVLATLTQPYTTHPYLVFPPLIWAALRFGPRGGTAATLLISIATVWSTVAGRGAFVVSSLGDNLTALAAFMSAVAFTALMLGATSAERTRALRAREQFISIASHELRTPLAPLRLQVQRLLRALRRDPSALTTDQLVEGLSVADRQAARLTALLENVLDLTRLERGPLPLRPEEVDAATIVEEAGATLRESFAHVGCTLAVERRGPTVGTWDRARLAQVVTNLLSNAVKHGGAGPIEVSVAGTSERTTIVVRDHGPGVPVEQRERIFARFQRAEAPAARTAGQPAGVHGLGLGLYIAREIVEAHGGRLTVGSPPDGGAAFEVELPTNRPGASAGRTS